MTLQTRITAELSILSVFPLNSISYCICFSTEMGCTKLKDPFWEMGLSGSHHPQNWLLWTHLQRNGWNESFCISLIFWQKHVRLFFLLLMPQYIVYTVPPNMRPWFSVGEGCNVLFRFEMRCCFKWSSLSISGYCSWVREEWSRRLTNVCRNNIVCTVLSWWRDRWAERQSHCLQIFVPTLTYDREVWVVTEGMRLWIEVTEMRTISQTYELSHSGGTWSRADAAPHWEEQAEVVKMPPLGGVLGISNQAEALGQTQDVLEGLWLLNNLGMSQCFYGGPSGGGWRQGGLDIFAEAAALWPELKSKWMDGSIHCLLVKISIIQNSFQLCYKLGPVRPTVPLTDKET